MKLKRSATTEGTEPALNKAVLKFIDVGRTYGEGNTFVAALEGISLELRKGELVAIVGRSGCGKSTLLRLAAGLDHPTSGQVRVHGSDPASMNESGKAKLRRSRIGVVFQRLNLLPDLTAIENVGLPLELEGVRPKAAMELAAEALQDVGLPDQQDRYPDELSGGQQQRVAIARGLVGDRSILLADEPTGALDEASGEAILELLRQRADAGSAVLFVTHDRALAAMADRIIEIRDGRISSVTDRSATPPDLAGVWA